jgi:hypothetical protein
MVRKELAMEKKICVVIVSSLLVASKIFAAAEGPTTPKSGEQDPFHNPFYQALMSIRSYEQYCAYIDKYQNYCGICGTGEPAPCEVWPHPFGNLAHAGCVASVSDIENDTIQGFKYKPATMDAYSDFHRLIVWFVSKLCSPHTIATFRKIEGEEELTRFYNHAKDLAFRRVDDYSALLERPIQPDHNKTCDKIKQDTKKILAFLFVGKLLFEQSH